MMNSNAQSTPQNYPILAAIALIIIGSIFLLRNFDVIDIGHNWWALFMLIPIAYSLASAWRQRQESGGKMPPAARSALIGSAVLTFVMCVFLFDLNWGMLWPVFLILGGLSIMFGTRS